MSKNFVSRLTDEQINSFLERYYPKTQKYSFSFFRTRDTISKPDMIYVHVDYNFDDSSFNMSLYDYTSIGLDHSERWIKYLYEIFNEEYQKAYLEKCAEIFS